MWLEEKCSTRSAVYRESLMSWPQCDLIYDLLLNRSTETLESVVFLSYNKKKANGDFISASVLL